MRKRLLVALSAANLNLLPVWNELLYLREDQLYFTPMATRSDFGWLLVSWLVLATGIGALLRAVDRGCADRLRARLAVWVLLGVNPLNFVRVQMGITLDMLSASAVAGVLAASAVLIVVALRTPRSILTGVEFVVLVLSPLCLTNAAQAVWNASPLSQRPSLVSPLIPSAASPPSRSLQRVVWIVFDELDGRMLFRERDGRAETPAFDALRSEANFYSRVSPPGGHTIEAMPSLWLGERVVRSRPRGASELDVELESRPGWRPLTQQPHLFRQAYASGARIGLVGFYHPYCRLFGSVAKTCSSGSFAVTRGWQPRDASEVLRAQWRALTPLWRRAVYLATHRHLAEQARAGAVDPDLDFVAIHLGIPHNPPIFDAARGELTWFRPGIGYRDNLALADRTLAEITEAMRAAGIWHDTALVVSSDHGWRDRDGYDREAAGAVPLFVKMPGQVHGQVDRRNFDALVVPRMLRALWLDELSEPGALATWMDPFARQAGTGGAAERN
jgi:hypothetical protein